MSSQTINTATISSLYQEAEEGIIENTKKQLRLKRFLLGKGYDEHQQRHYIKIYDIINRMTCCTRDYLSFILKNGPDDSYESNINIPGLIDKKNIKPAETLYQLWLDKGNTGSFSDFLDMLFNNNTDIWEEVQW